MAGELYLNEALIKKKSKSINVSFGWNQTTLNILQKDPLLHKDSNDRLWCLMVLMEHLKYTLN